jgi:hypothetical protein
MRRVLEIDRCQWRNPRKTRGRSTSTPIACAWRELCQSGGRRSRPLRSRYPHQPPTPAHHQYAGPSACVNASVLPRTCHTLAATTAVATTATANPRLRTTWHPTSTRRPASPLSSKPLPPAIQTHQSTTNTVGANVPARTGEGAPIPLPLSMQMTAATRLRDQVLAVPSPQTQIGQPLLALVLVQVWVPLLASVRVCCQCMPTMPCFYFSVRDSDAD